MPALGFGTLPDTAVTRTAAREALDQAVQHGTAFAYHTQNRGSREREF
jgi:hypothetical protein